ncbi:MAG: DUF4058 family protein [Planctomycetaceae bacterium]
MPLLDHFHPPLKEKRDWDGVHALWASVIVQHLNDKLLPDRYFAEPQVKWGRMAQIDVGTIDLEPSEAAMGQGGLATAVWSPPRAALRAAVDFADLDDIEVRVYKSEGGRKLVAAVELISPANKDRPTHREAFAIKCAAYLQRGVSVVMVDIVTERTANLHGELMRLLQMSNSAELTSELYAAAYRTTGSGDEWFLEVWPRPLAVGAPLPTLPLWLAGDLAVPLDLDQTYSTTCRSLRI